MSQYQKECNRCGQKIKMSDELGKWMAFELDGKNVHECRTKGEEQSSAPKQDTPTYTLDQVVKKLESIGIIVNVERMMTQ